MNSKQNKDGLLNAYNLAVAQNRDLRDQLETLRRQADQREIVMGVTVKHARDLCSAILAKDKAEMSLGSAKGWHSLSTDDLIARAMESFTNYCKDKTDILNQVMQIAETRGRELESLKDQISQMMISGNINSVVSPEELIERAEKQKREDAAIKNAPASTRKAISEGRVEIIIEENEDVDESEMGAISQMMDVATKAKLTPSGKPIVKNERKKKMAIDAEEKSVKPHMVDIQRYLNECAEAEFAVLQVMGERGMYNGPEIRAACMADYQISGYAATSALSNLAKMQAISKERISLPLTPYAAIYELTDIGQRMFSLHFKKEPVKSVLAAIRAEHDNIVHGLGIVTLKKVFEESGRYKSVNCSNRNNPIIVEIGGHEHQYIPDFICKTDHSTEYFEYDLGNHTEVSFNLKCNKMARVTKVLNFIAPNKEDALKIKSQVDKWIASRQASKPIKVSIHIGTAHSIKNGGEWMVEYDLRKSLEPIKNTWEAV